MLAGVHPRTPIWSTAAAFSKATGNQVYIKPENMQVTGAYKIRGAYYKISTLTDGGEGAGPHHRLRRQPRPGGGLRRPGTLGCSATIVMPTTTPLVKVNNTKDYGPRSSSTERPLTTPRPWPPSSAQEKGLTYVHPFNDLTVATGQGTIAYEIFQDLPDVDVILVPIGGGGLAAGVSTLAKLLNPKVKVHRGGAHRRGLHEGQPGGGPCGHPGPCGDHRRRRGGQDPWRPSVPLHSEECGRHHHHRRLASW